MGWILFSTNRLNPMEQDLAALPHLLQVMESPRILLLWAKGSSTRVKRDEKTGRKCYPLFCQWRYHSVSRSAISWAANGVISSFPLKIETFALVYEKLSNLLSKLLPLKAQLTTIFAARSNFKQLPFGGDNT